MSETHTMPGKVTIKDIAREMNIAYSTVSRALNNTSGISNLKRTEILKKAQEMGYEPNLLARNLRSGSSNTIGLIVPRINRVFFSNVIHGVESEARAEGYNVIICQSNENLSDENKCIRTLLANNVAGILMSLSRESEEPGLHKEITKRELPFVMFDRIFTEMEINKVYNDNFKGAYSVTSHMISKGYKNILHFAGPMSINIYRDRAEGYKQAIKSSGLKMMNRNIIENVISRDRGFEVMKNLVKSGLDFDGVFAASDFSALGAMMCLKNMGIDVPRQLGLAGYANEPFTDLIGLTTVDQHSTEIGRSAARLLFEEIGNESAKQMKKEVVVNTELVVRESTNKNK